MTLHRICLGGCQPQPLASYLKGLGVFRVVAEQKDDQARVLWQDDTLVLVSSLTEDDLLDFFLNEWQPGAFVSPWNKGSGFFNAQDKGIAPIEASTAARFGGLRAGIAAARVLAKEMNDAVQAERLIKDEPKGLSKPARERLKADPDYKQRLSATTKRAKTLKDALQFECQKTWRGGPLRWLRSAVVLDADGRASFPGLLGTGGNDGKLDFTNNAMQRLADLFDLSDPQGSPRPDARLQLRAALFGQAAPTLVAGAIGQFSPAASGGANASSGALAKSRLNPWDLPLLLEGSLLFVASSNRRLLGRDQPRVAAPFAVRNQAAGAPTQVAGEESSRGEQWMPLWERPWSLAEVRTVLAEGRAQLGRRTGKDALDMTRAIARLGVARGITAFQRYGYLERNGKSNYAVPLGRWTVHANAHATLLDDLDRFDWWARLQRAARSDQAPASVVHLERNLSELVVAALRHGGESARWRQVALSLAQIEAALVRSQAFTAKQRLGPLPPMGRGWLGVLGDDATVRLALALAWAGGPRRSDQLRAHWLPQLDSPARFASGASGLRVGPRMVVDGRDAEADLISVVLRRLIDAKTGAGRVLPLPGVPGLEARLDDLLALLGGRVDLTTTLWLARFLACLDKPPAASPSPRMTTSAVDPAWAIIRLAHLAGPLRPGTSIPVDPAIVRLLQAGDSGRALEIARRRLWAAGIRAPISTSIMSSAAARRLAASLAFPISTHSVQALARGLHPALESTAAPTAQEASHVH